MMTVFEVCSYLQVCGPSAQKRNAPFSKASKCNKIRSKASAA